jgi:putative transposase
MSKLFWLQGYRQLKLITALHQDTKSTGHLIISPRQEHEINFGEDMVKMLPENGIAVGDRSKATLFSLSAFQLEMGRKPSCRYETQYKLCYDHAGITISFQEPCSRSRMPDQSNP